jgi:hypothetical protein
MQRAAELTLQNGYTHFRLENAEMSQGSQLAAAYATEAGNTLATGYGGAAFATGYSTGIATPIYKVHRRRGCDSRHLSRRRILKRRTHSTRLRSSSASLPQ